MPPSIDAYAIARLSTSLTRQAANVESAAARLPRVFASDAATASVDNALQLLHDDVRAAAAQVAGSTFEPPMLTAAAAIDDARSAIAQLRSPRRSRVAPHVRSIEHAVSTLTDELATTRRAELARRVGAGGEDLASAREDVLRAVDEVAAGEPPLGATDLLLDAVAADHRRIRPPDIRINRSLDELLNAAPDDANAAFDLRRLLAAWRTELASTHPTGQQLRAEARSLLTRGADDLDGADWDALARLVDQDPAGAFVQLPAAMPGPRPRGTLDIIAEGSRGIVGGDQRLLVELADLRMAGADADVGTLRREARNLLGRDPHGYTDRDWARLAAISVYDPYYRVLPHESATTIAASIDAASQGLRVEPSDLLRTRRGSADSIAMLERWQELTSGPVNRAKLRAYDAAIDRFVRGLTRVEAELGEAVENGLAPGATEGEVVRHLALRSGQSIGRLLTRKVRDGVDAVRSAPITDEQVASVVAGGAIPERLDVARLVRSNAYRSATRTEQAAAAARVVARSQPRNSPQARRFVQEVRTVPVPEAELSPELRAAWREARATIDEQDRWLRQVGRAHDGYLGAPDYARLGTVGATLDAIGIELGIRARAAAADAATTAHAAPARASARTVEPAATVVVDDAAAAPWELVEPTPATASPIDEALDW